jgi:hypothetical protein
MTKTGWTGEQPDEPALPVTEQLLRNRERGPGDTLAIAQARSHAADVRQARDEAEAVRDPDEVASALVNRGYTPGHLSGLHRQRQEKAAELEAERAKIEKGERVTARVRGMLERGQIGGMEAHQRMDGDFGDEVTAAKLERQIARLDERILEAAAMIAPPQPERDPDPVAAASRAAHDVFVETTRALMAGTRTVPQRRRPPFESVSRGGTADVTCAECVKAGATAEQSAEIHAGMALRDVQQTALNPGQEVRRGNLGTGYDEVQRCSDCGYVYCKCGVADARTRVRPGTPSAVYR